MENIPDTIRIIIIEKLGLHEGQLNDTNCLIREFGIDSLDMLEIYWEIEKTFKVSISEEDSKKLTTILEMSSYIKSKITL
jgi:acyl carrier protein